MSLPLPVLVIVGRPNVGKSTLFNRIVGRREAVVHDQPGVTRDRLYIEAEHEGKRFQVVDTGGILFGEDDPLVDQIRLQAEVALSEADAVIFLTDAETGLHAADWDLAERLRGFAKPVAVAPNKADNPDRALQANEFFQLGFEHVFPVSAVHGNGLDELLDFVTSDFTTTEESEPEDETRIAILGRPNVGKSSLVNALVGEERAIVSDIPGTTRDAIDTKLIYKGRTIRLIDTAGLRRRGKIQGSIEYYMALRAAKAMRRAHCAVVVLDGREGLTDGDKRVAKAAHDQGKPSVLAINKWDLKEPPTGELGKDTALKKDFRKIMRQELPEIDYAPVRFCSALEATGWEGVIKASFAVIESWRTRVPTAQLNRLVQDWLDRRPLDRKGKTLRIKYATQASIEPPTFVAFCNDPEMVHFSYVRYLENQIREQWPLEGTPIRIEIRKSGA